MFAETVVGYIDFIKNKIPLRDFEREANVSLNLSLLLHSVDCAPDRKKKKLELRDLIMPYSLWNEGEKLGGVIEEALVKGHEASKVIQPPRPELLTRDTFNHVIESIATKATLNEIDLSQIRKELPKRPYAFDVVVYDPQQNRLRVINILYGIAAQKRALAKWHRDSFFAADLWDRLGPQYLGIEDARCEFTLIDPLLEESHIELGIWALADLDEPFGIPGVADKALNVQEALREEVTIYLGDLFAKTEAEQQRLIDEAFVDIALQALESELAPNYRILTPPSK